MTTSKSRFQNAMRSGKPTFFTHYWGETLMNEALFGVLGSNSQNQLAVQLGTDVVQLQATEPEAVDHGSYIQNMWGERYVMKDVGYGLMREDLEGALAGAASMSDLETFPWPKNDDIDYSPVASEAEKYPDHILLYGFADIWERPALTRGYANGLADLIEHPDWVHYLTGKYTDFYMEDYRRAQEAAKGKIDVFLLLSDLGAQCGPLISKRSFREFVLPRIEQMAQTIHQLGAKVLFHSCGYAQPFIDDLIQAGVDILDPIQPVAPVMEPESLATEFTGRIAFHGGIDLVSVLESGTPDDVRAAVQRYFNAFENRCTYFCCSAHLMQPNVPIPNVLALYDEAVKQVALRS